ncbi:hypothetical protein J4U00_gp115 [Mycobacterium phage DyoEdafos]|uniref:Uncharacterized protein n=1 Tax=Mycobacterium phage DyoEdafos TaxID=2599860 RepID=A0A5J6TK26_9CAUD|nr:hypothetical protein J4U00_gp115 [Mycobacterium phage DyoEdafos]QFG10364.1 hypothetical protein SEA_DYOEDAFOS_154 [Mycobacterium phage DyoEdafos]
MELMSASHVLSLVYESTDDDGDTFRLERALWDNGRVTYVASTVDTFGQSAFIGLSELQAVELAQAILST